MAQIDAISVMQHADNNGEIPEYSGDLSTNQGAVSGMAFSDRGHFTESTLGTLTAPPKSPRFDRKSWKKELMDEKLHESLKRKSPHRIGSDKNNKQNERYNHDNGININYGIASYGKRVNNNERNTLRNLGIVKPEISNMGLDNGKFSIIRRKS